MRFDFLKNLMGKSRKPAEGRAVQFEQADRSVSDVSRNLVPEHVDRILRAANNGDPRDQARLAAEITEKNWDIFQALQTRRLAVAGLEWEMQPGDDSAQAKKIAADFEQVLRSPHYEQTDDDISTFDQAIVFEMMDALLPGFSMTEIIWGTGGQEIQGFVGIPQCNFTFQDSRTPRLVTTDHPLGIELPRSKFIYHRHFARSGDATRGGLIRPLAWLDVFERKAGVTDLMSFIERYGMPFLVATVNSASWDTEKNKIKYLIQNFGSAGGACFSDAVTTELLQAANNTGDVYFKLLEYTGDAITKVVLGQTASSGDAGGFSKGQTQDKVRADIKVSDAKAIDSTLTSRLAANWTSWNYGPNAPVPRVHHLIEEPEDLKLASEVLSNLNTAGVEAFDENELSDRFGWKLRRKVSVAVGGIPPSPALPADSAALAAELTVTSPQSAIRDPQSIADSALQKFLDGRGLEDWFGPLHTAIAGALRGSPDEDEFKARMQKLLEALPDLLEQMDSTEFEEYLSKTIYTAAAEAQAEAAKRLSLTEAQRNRE